MIAELLTSVLALSVIAPLAAKASLMSGQDLLSACGGDGNGRTVCDGYLMGLTDIVLQRKAAADGGKICLPASVTVDQVRDAVLAVGHRPRLMRAPSGVAVVAAAMRSPGGAPATRPEPPTGSRAGS